MAKVMHNAPQEEKEVWKRGDILVLKEDYKAKADNPERVVLFLSKMDSCNFQGVELQGGDLDSSWAIVCFKKAPKGYTVTLANE